MSATVSTKLTHIHSTLITKVINKEQGKIEEYMNESGNRSNE